MLQESIVRRSSLSPSGLGHRTSIRKKSVAFAEPKHFWENSEVLPEKGAEPQTLIRKNSIAFAEPKPFWENSSEVLSEPRAEPQTLIRKNSVAFADPKPFWENSEVLSEPGAEPQTLIRKNSVAFAEPKPFWENCSEVLSEPGAEPQIESPAKTRSTKSLVDTLSEMDSMIGSLSLRQRKKHNDSCPSGAGVAHHNSLQPRLAITHHGVNPRATLARFGLEPEPPCDSSESRTGVKLGLDLNNEPEPMSPLGTGAKLGLPAAWGSPISKDTPSYSPGLGLEKEKNRTALESKAVVDTSTRVLAGDAELTQLRSDNKNLSQSYARLATGLLNWSEGLHASRRRTIADLILHNAKDCQHLSLDIQSAVSVVRSQRDALQDDASGVSLEVKLCRLEQELSNASDQVESLRGRLSRVTKENETLSQRVSNVDLANEPPLADQKKAESLQARVVELTNENDEHAEKILKLTSERTALLKQIAELSESQLSGPLERRQQSVERSPSNRDRVRLVNTILGSERIELSFGDLDFEELDQAAFEADMLDSLEDLGFSTGGASKLAIALRTKPAIVEIRGPARQIHELKTLPLSNLLIMGKQPEVVCNTCSSTQQNTNPCQNVESVLCRENCVVTGVPSSAGKTQSALSDASSISSGEDEGIIEIDRNGPRSKQRISREHRKSSDCSDALPAPTPLGPKGELQTPACLCLSGGKASSSEASSEEPEFELHAPSPKSATHQKFAAIRIPEGTHPGDVLEIELDGHRVEVSIPDDAQAGETVHMELEHHAEQNGADLHQIAATTAIEPQGQRGAASQTQKSQQQPEPEAPPQADKVGLPADAPSAEAKKSRFTLGSMFRRGTGASAGAGVTSSPGGGSSLTPNAAPQSLTGVGVTSSPSVSNSAEPSKSEKAASQNKRAGSRVMSFFGRGSRNQRGRE